MTAQLADAWLAGSAVATGTGLHTVTWGAYKDSPYEGFSWVRLVRTLAVAQLVAWLAVTARVVDPAAVIPTVGVIYTLERLTTEWWKTILRGHDPAAFTIPMRLGYRGRPVDSRWRRYCAGALVLVAMAGIALALHQLQNIATGTPRWVTVLCVGGFGGWATALGGAWKDAPIEGFSRRKFLRSPLVASAWAVPCSLLTNDWVTLCLASGGFAVATIETYKTFMTGGRPPGKFAGRPPIYSLPFTRRVLAGLHGGAWWAFAVAALWSAIRPAPAFGLPVGEEPARLASLVVAGIAVLASQICLRSGRAFRTTAEGVLEVARAPRHDESQPG